MPKRKTIAIGALALASALSGCEDYLSGSGLTTNPNQPSVAAIDQLLTAVQVQQFVWHEGDMSRVPSMWTQQMAGTDRQYIAYDEYDLTEDDLSGEFSNVYTGGGLVDLRQIQALAEERGDAKYKGVAQVLEAFLIGMAASFWGDIPYSEAVNDEIAKPALDEQASVYAAVQALLDQAVTNLQGSGAGPGSADLIYGGDASQWVEAAHTLKARFYMHWVEAQSAGGQTACGGDCAQQAIAAAEDGISTPANNFLFPHSATTGEENIWYQFMFVQRPGYISAGKNLVDLLIERDDPRLEEYFAPTGSGQFIGSAPGDASTASTLSAERGAPSFHQPFITYAENELILAEAYYRIGEPGSALVHLNNARSAEGLDPLLPLVGTALLEAIMEEKYIALFQNPEVWNDYKRTCLPDLTPAAGAAAVPGRFLYGSEERNVNPNIPPPAEQPARNDNDPNPCA